MTKLALLSAFLLSSVAQAAMEIPLEHQFGSIEVTEIRSAAKKVTPKKKNTKEIGLPSKPMSRPTAPETGRASGQVDPRDNEDDFYYGSGRNSGTNSNSNTSSGMGFDYYNTEPTRVEQAGQIIQRARDVVALGEEIYNLVQKGKPKNQTEYSPVSVVPVDPSTKQPVDMFDLEGFTMPKTRNYNVKIRNAAGAVAVDFSYKVVYSYGGSYNGAGKYLTGVSIIPSSVTTKFGWDFNSSMKISGLMNHGTKADPVAGVMLTVKYQMNSWGKAFERNDTIHITGRGELKNYNISK